MRAATMALIAALSIVGAAKADDAPVTVSSSAIDGQPKVKVKHLPGGDQWQLGWRRDEAERTLNFVFIRAEGNNEPRLALARDIHDLAFKEGLTEDKDTADVRVEDTGKSTVWRGQAQWVLGSELAERAPTAPGFSLNNMSGKAPRGPERRYCVSFVWSDGGKQAAAGAYCRVAKQGASEDAKAMLEVLDLKID